MPISQTPYLLTQMARYIDRDYFEYLVKAHQGNRYVKNFSCWNQLMVLFWAQLTTRRSLRDIVCSLRAHHDKLYRLGMGRNVSKSTLAEANANRDVAIFRELAVRMMQKASAIGVVDMELREIADAFNITGFFAGDSSTIQLNTTLFNWSSPKQGYGGIKMHTLLDLLRSIPAMVMITGHEDGDQIFMDDYPYQKGCLYVFDKAYVKARSLFHIASKGAFFIVRRKSDLDISVERHIALDEDNGVLADQIISFSGPKSRKGYPERLRMVTFYAESKNEAFVFLTNNLDIPPHIIAELYLRRWDIEQFFRWIKQHLYIQNFYGRSVNAVCIQIYVAVITFCVICLIADRYSPPVTRYELLRLLGTALFEKRELSDILEDLIITDNRQHEEKEFGGTKSLFD